MRKNEFHGVLLLLFIFLAYMSFFYLEEGIILGYDSRTEGSTIELASPIKEKFSNDYLNPTEVEINTYYNIQNMGAVYIEAKLEAGEVYLIYKLGGINPITLAYDPQISEIILKQDDKEEREAYILFAPMVSTEYYIKCNLYLDRDYFFGIFKAKQYEEKEVVEGFNIEANNEEWAKSFIYFNMPDTSKLNIEDITLSIPSKPFYYNRVDLKSDQAILFSSGDWTYDTRNLVHLLYNNSEKGFIMLFNIKNQQQVFQIDIPYESDNTSFYIIPIMVVVIISIVVIIVKKRKTGEEKGVQKTIQKTKKKGVEKPLEKAVKLPLPFKAYRGSQPYIFVSYSHEDSKDVYQEIKWIHNKGFNMWYDEGISLTAEWPEEIENAVLNCTVFVVFISENAVESISVRNEINYALNENKKLLGIFLKKTKLKHGLKLRMGSIQFIKKYKMDDLEYEEKVLGALQAILNPK